MLNHLNQLFLIFLQIKRQKAESYEYNTVLPTMHGRLSLTGFQKNQAKKYSNINVPSSCSNHWLEKYSYVIKGMTLISKHMNEVLSIKLVIKFFS